MHRSISKDLHLNTTIVLSEMKAQLLARSCTVCMGLLPLCVNLIQPKSTFMTAEGGKASLYHQCAQQEIMMIEMPRFTWGVLFEEVALNFYAQETV